MFLTAGVAISVSYRAGHAFAAFGSDLKKGSADLAIFNSQIIALRAGMVKWGIGAVGVGIFAHGLNKAARNAEDLQVSLANIQMTMGANNRQMDDYQIKLAQAGSRTRFNMQEINEQARTYALSIPGLPQGMEGFNRVTGVMTTIAEVNSVMKSMKNIEPVNMARSAAAFTGMFPGGLTPESLKKNYQLFGSMMMVSPLKDPQQLIRQFAFMQRAFPGAPPEEQFGLLNTLGARGMMPGRSASLAGQLMHYLIQYAAGKTDLKHIQGGFGADVNPNRMRLHPAELMFGPGYIKGMGAGGKFSTSDALGIALGLGPLRQQALQAQAEGKPLPFGPKELLGAIQEGARNYKPMDWIGVTSNLPSQISGPISQLADPKWKVLDELNLSVAKLAVMVNKLREMANIALHLAQGARLSFETNVGDLWRILGMHLNVGFAGFFSALSKATMGLIKLASEFPGLTRSIMIAASTLAGLGIMKVGIGMAGVAATGVGALATAGYLGAGTAGVLGVALPWVGVALGGLLAAKFFSPLIFEVYNWLAGIDPRAELEKVAVGLDKQYPVTAQRVRSGEVEPGKLEEEKVRENAARALARFNIPNNGVGAGVGAGIGGTGYGGGYMGGPGNYPPHMMFQRADGLYDVSNQFHQMGSASVQAAGNIAKLGEVAKVTADKEKQKLELPPNFADPTATPSFSPPNLPNLPNLPGAKRLAAFGDALWSGVKEAAPKFVKREVDALKWAALPVHEFNKRRAGQDVAMGDPEMWNAYLTSALRMVGYQAFQGTSIKNKPSFEMHDHDEVREKENRVISRMSIHPEDELSSSPENINRDTHQDRPGVAHFSFDSSSTRSFSTEMQAPRTTGARQVRSSMVQKNPRALHHPKGIDLPGR